MERIIERYNKETNNWEVIKFKELTKDDIFRIFDNDIRYVNLADGNNVWVAKSEPYLNKDGVYTIDTLY